MNVPRVRSLLHQRPRCGAVMLLLGAAAAPAHSQPMSLDTLAMRGDTYFLSHDLLLGRQAGSRGARLAALYIAARCQAIGLVPFGERYLQPVALERALVLEETELAIVGAARRLRWRFPDIIPNLGTRQAMRDFRGPAVYVGTSEQISGGELGERDIRGAVAITLGMSSRAAIDTFRRHGMSGVVHLIPDSADFQRQRKQLGASRLYDADTAITSSYLPDLPSVIAGPGASLALARATSHSGTGPELMFHLALERSSVLEMNVVCGLLGSDPQAADSAIVLVAHYDHLGIGPPDATGDSIYNGFSDNAAGVAMLLALAKALVSAEIRHSVVFLFPAAEEAGLLGSDFYVARPTWPLERTLAVINLDAGAPPAPPAGWQLAGVDSTGLGGLALGVAAGQGWRGVTSPPRPIGDFYPFTERGIPAVLIIPGAGPFQGLSADSSAALRRRWDRYHQPSDEWSSLFPLAGMLRYAQYAGLIIWEIDNRR